MAGVDNTTIAAILDTVGKIMEIQGENRFKVRAYTNASRQIKALSRPARELVQDGTLGDVPGIGEALLEKITELVETGKLKFYEEMRSAIPDGVLDMLRIPGVGPKKVKTLWEDMGLTTLHELEEACNAGKIAGLKGFGKKIQDKILSGIEFIARHEGQFRLGDALPVARKLIANLKATGLVEHIDMAGSIRRRCQVVKDIDILATSDTPEQVMKHFSTMEEVVEVIGSGKTKTSVRLTSGIQVDLRVVEHAQFPYALLYFTGSKDHNIQIRSRAQKMGLRVNEYGIYKGEELLPAKTEHDCYAILKLPYIAPELRENAGEIQAAEKGELPDLVSLQDIQGVFHTHSTWSDGTASVKEMADKARSLGLKYIGLSDHSQAAAYANGLNAERLQEQWKEIDELNKGWDDFQILKGLECDILGDGELDLPADVLSKLDFVVCSIHSRFDMPEEEMTKRVCKALQDKNLHILGHPTGRLLLNREGFAMDMSKVIATAKEQRKILELNAHPHRLDLDWVTARRAGEEGVMVSINPDAHSTKGIENVEYGVATARRAWLTKEQVLNTRPWPEAKKILQRG